MRRLPLYAYACALAIVTACVFVATTPAPVDALRLRSLLALRVRSVHVRNAALADPPKTPAGERPKRTDDELPYLEPREREREVEYDANGQMIGIKPRDPDLIRAAELSKAADERDRKDGKPTEAERRKAKRDADDRQAAAEAEAARKEAQKQTPADPTKKHELRGVEVDPHPVKPPTPDPSAMSHQPARATTRTDPTRAHTTTPPTTQPAARAASTRPKANGAGAAAKPKGGNAKPKKRSGSAAGGNGKPKPKPNRKPNRKPKGGKPNAKPKGANSKPKPKPKPKGTKPKGTGRGRKPKGKL